MDFCVYGPEEKDWVWAYSSLHLPRMKRRNQEQEQRVTVFRFSELCPFLVSTKTRLLFLFYSLIMPLLDRDQLLDRKQGSERGIMTKRKQQGAGN